MASYAAAQREKLVGSGVQVQRLTFQKDGSADYQFSNETILGLHSAFAFFRANWFDHIILHFTEELVWPKARSRFLTIPVRILQFFLVYKLLRNYGSKIDVYVHEITTTLPRNSWKRKIRDFIFSSGQRLSFHTEEERRAFLSCYPSARPMSTRLVDHAENFKPKYGGSKSDARLELELEPEWKAFLCIGFIAPHKGLEDAIDGLKGTIDKDLRLFIVGSTRSDSKEGRDYIERLKEMAKSDPRIVIRNTYVDDKCFDMWIKAADAVILPYKEIWSSGVGARSTVLETPIIARGHPNLRSQFASSSVVTFFTSQHELTDHMNLFCQQNK